MSAKYRFCNVNSIYYEQAQACINFFTKLSELLSDDYELVHSNAKEYLIFHEHLHGRMFRISDHYLIPFGTKSKITYYTKPYWSFRISDHWNWYDTIKNCGLKNYLQCFNADLPRPKTRYVDNESRSDAVKAVQVAIFGNQKDDCYHCVYGAYRDKSTHQWTWMESTPEEVAEKYCLI